MVEEDMQVRRCEDDQQWVFTVDTSIFPLPGCGGQDIEMHPTSKEAMGGHNRYCIQHVVSVR